jgi:hypothetical protein
MAAADWSAVAPEAVLTFWFPTTATTEEEAYIATGQFPHVRELPATVEGLERMLTPGGNTP